MTISNIQLSTLGTQKVSVNDLTVSGIKGEVIVQVYDGKLISAAAGGIITNSDGTSIEIPAGSPPKEPNAFVNVASDRQQDFTEQAENASMKSLIMMPHY